MRKTRNYESFIQTMQKIPVISSNLSLLSYTYQFVPPTCLQEAKPLNDETCLN